MKYATSAALAIVLGLGFATAAQAHGTMRQSAVPNAGASAMNTQTSVQGPQAQATQPTQRATRRQIKQAQQQLRSDGLYKGRIDGIAGRRTHQAIARFQQRNHLPRTARLDQNTLSRLTGAQAVGVGSSTPAGPTINHNLTGNPNPAQITPPATQAPGAGGNDTVNTPTHPDQNANH